MSEQMNGFFPSYPQMGGGSARDIAAGLIEALGHPAATLDEHLHIVSANSHFLPAFATDPDHLIGSDVILLGDASLRERIGSTLATAAADGVTCEIEADVPSLGRRRLALRVARMGRASAELGSLLLTVEDLTGREPPGATPGAGRSRVLAAATHDLRQPLQAMTLLGSLLARRVNDPAVLPLIERLEDTIRAMSGMLNTLLDIHKWETEPARAEPSAFGTAELFERMRTEFLDRMRERRLRWRVVACRQIVLSDQRLLAQMLRNLIQYAIEHSHDGRMLLGARRHGQRLRIELWDSGLETTDSDVQGAYDTLRGDTARGAAIGAALSPGLSMVRRIADLLGHRIEVGFKPGRGSVFSIEVPLVAPAPPASPRASALADPDRVARGTVYVIDDDSTVRETLRDLLDATGWATEGFSSSEEFLRGDLSKRIGCILVDAFLPGMTGTALLRALAKHHDRLPAIMLTGAGDVRIAVEAMAAGALNFIEKPVRYEELLPTIERAFDLLADSSKLALWREEATQRAASLTPRQREILELVLAGQPSRNIATSLGVSRRTVENHRAAIMKKMGAASIPQLIRVGIAAS